MNKNQYTMNKNTEASIKKLEMQIGQLSRQMEALASKNGGFVRNTIYNPKNESCKAIELRNKVVPSSQKIIGKGKEASESERKIEEDIVVENEVDKISEGEKSENTSENEVKGLTLETFLDKDSPSIRNKKKIVNEPNSDPPDYVKTPYPILKKKPKKEMEVGQFKMFMDMQTKMHVNNILCEALKQMLVYAIFMKEVLLGK